MAISKEPDEPRNLSELRRDQSLKKSDEPPKSHKTKDQKELDRLFKKITPKNAPSQ